MQSSRVIVCKLGRFGELRKVIDTNINQLQEESGAEHHSQEVEQNSKSFNASASRQSNMKLFSMNHNFEDFNLGSDNEMLVTGRDSVTLILLNSSYVGVCC